MKEFNRFPNFTEDRGVRPRLRGPLIISLQTFFPVFSCYENEEVKGEEEEKEKEKEEEDEEEVGSFRNIRSHISPNLHTFTY